MNSKKRSLDNTSEDSKEKEKEETTRPTKKIKTSSSQNDKTIIAWQDPSIAYREVRYREKHHFLILPFLGFDHFSFDEYEFELIELPQWNWDGTECVHRKTECVHRKNKNITLEFYECNRLEQQFKINFDLSDTELEYRLGRANPVYPPCFLQIKEKQTQKIVFQSNILHCGEYDSNLIVPIQQMLRNNFRLFVNDIPLSNCLIDKIQQYDVLQKNEKFSPLLIQCFSFLDTVQKNFKECFFYKLKKDNASEIVKVTVKLDDFFQNDKTVYAELLLSSDQTCIIEQVLKQCFFRYVDVNNLVRYLEWDRNQHIISVKKEYKTYPSSFQLKKINNAVDLEYADEKGTTLMVESETLSITQRDHKDESSKRKNDQHRFWMADCTILNDVTLNNNFSINNSNQNKRKDNNITIPAHLFYNYEQERNVLLNCVNVIKDVYYLIFDYWNPKLCIPSFHIDFKSNNQNDQNDKSNQNNQISQNNQNDQCNNIVMNEIYTLSSKSNLYLCRGISYLDVLNRGSRNFCIPGFTNHEYNLTDAGKDPVNQHFVQIFVKIFRNDTFETLTFFVYLRHTVNHVKFLIKEVAYISVNHQVLKFKDRVLENEMPLFMYGIDQNSTLHMFFAR
jgi:hypothetical protein